MRRALITGGAGFIGSHVIRRFLDAGFAVDALDDLSSGKRENLPDDLRLHEMDIRSPEAARLVADGPWDVIVHLAAQMDVRRSVADPLFDASVNIIGTLNLLEAARAAPPESRPRFVFASTGGAVYGDFAVPPNREPTAKDPESPYAVSKLSVEHYLAYYGRVHSVDAVALRYANVYGPRQDPHGEAGVVAIFCGRVLAGEAIRIFGDGTQTRDYVYVGDVAEATFRAATSELPARGRLDERALNVGTGVETSVLRLASVLQDVAKRSVPTEFAPHRPGEQQRSALDIGKITQVLGWTPRTSLEEGLMQTYHWFAARSSRPSTPART